MFSVTDLVGHTILNIFINNDKTLLTFITDKGFVEWEAEGDCCSESWFHHADNLPTLVGKKITKVVDKEWVQLSIGTKQESDKMYFIEISAGNSWEPSALVELRNSSNGYYGGFVSVRMFTDAWSPKGNQYKVERDW